MQNKTMVKVITNDKYTDFILSNWCDVMAIQEVIKKAEETLPNWLIEQTRGVFREMETNCFQNKNMPAEDYIAAENFWWDPCGKYDRNNCKGPALCFYYNRELENIWDYLKSKNPELVPQLSFTVEAKGKKKANRNIVFKKWIKHVNKYISKLKGNRHTIITPDADVDSLELVYYSKTRRSY